jgi:hypothetical protein
VSRCLETSRGFLGYSVDVVRWSSKFFSPWLIGPSCGEILSAEKENASSRKNSDLFFLAMLKRQCRTTTKAQTAKIN